MNAPELSPEEAKIVARFEAAPTPPEVLREQLAAALWEANRGAVPWSDLSPRTPTRDEYRRYADAALAVFRGQQDPAVQRVLALADELDVKAERVCATSAHACAAYANAADRIRAAIGGDGR